MGMSLDALAIIGHNSYVARERLQNAALAEKE
jgi:hypothetical protein